MAEYDKFRAVVKEYEQKFGFDNYYFLLVNEMNMHLEGTVLEIGAGNGILPAKLNQIWNGRQLTYYSVDPVEEAVAIAKDRIINRFTHIPKIGTLGNVIEACEIEDIEINALIASRSLHEIFLGYRREKGKLYSHLAGFLAKKTPKIVIYGILERYEGLSEEETKRLMFAQLERIGHCHDPAKDYLDFSCVVDFMKEQGYILIKEHHLTNPLDGFDPSPWRFGICVLTNKISGDVK